MIGLSPDFTYFDLVFCDCTGLMICPDDMEPHRGINLRSAAEVARCAEWLRELSWPTECRAEELRLPGFLPEMAGASVEGRYDATELHLYGVWRMDADDGLCFHLAACTSPDPDEPELFGLDAAGIPFDLLPKFAEALDVIAERMASESLDLTKDQPLND